jgi:Zn-dependent protease with chaperone function
VSYVLEIILALATLTLPELGWSSGRALPLVVFVLALVPHLLGSVAHRALLTGRFRLGVVIERLLFAAPVLLQALAVGELGWLTTLEEAGHGPAGDEVGLALLPGLAPYFAYQLLAIDARARSLVFPPDTPGKVRAFHLRLFLAALLPVGAYLGGASLLARSPEWNVRVDEVGLLGAAMLVLVIALLLRAMPYFLRYAWDTAPLERGWARTMLEEAARKAGFRFRELLVWRTGQQMSNAAIVGFSERSRLVFFSDLLLAQLGPRELAAVFAHEMGHARRGHALTFGVFALGFFLVVQRLVLDAGIEGELALVALLVGLLMLWYLAFGYLSRRFELEADLESLRVVGESAPLARALELVTGAHAHARSSWRHFSTRDRVAFLRSAEADPLVGLRLRRMLARWRAFGVALLLLAGAAEVRALLRDWDEDWVVADLRLGRYEAAAERAAEPGVDPELILLARLGQATPPASRAPADLWLLAYSAGARGDFDRARGWLELARLRGAQGLEGLIEELDREGSTQEARAQAWREAVRAMAEPRSKKI